MKYSLIFSIATLLCVCQQIEARTQPLMLADEAVVQQAEIVAAAVQNGKPEKTENNDKTELTDPKTKPDCTEKGSENEIENILIIDADELQRILELAEEAQGRATRRYNLRLRRGPSRGNRRRLRGGNRRRAGLRRVRPNRNRSGTGNSNGQPVRRATLRRRTG